MPAPCMNLLMSEQIYATSEERKQRNRQAQAAFRERRTEYIKQLETTIKHQDETLQSLQQSHRSAADECLMLRYKNSLLERILLEKGKPPLLRDRSPMYQPPSRYRRPGRAQNEGDRCPRQDPSVASAAIANSTSGDESTQPCSTEQYRRRRISPPEVRCQSS